MQKLIIFRNIIRIISLSSVLVFALVLGTGLAKAGISIDGGNNTTGPNSENNNEWKIDHDIDIKIDNHARVDEEQNFEVETGRMEVEQNTEIEDISTGDVWGTIEVSNSINDADIELMSIDPGNIHIDMSNNTTGPSSENENEFTLDMDHDVRISNHALINNDLKLDVNTGETNVNHNTKVGDVSTGDIRFDIETVNEANNGASDIDLSHMGGLSISGDLENELTGPNSSNRNEIRIDVDSDINIRNTANIENQTDINVNSGRNIIDHNTVVGDISTGSVRIDSTTTNMAN